MDEAPTGKVDREDHHWKEWYHDEVASVYDLIMTLRESFPHQFCRNLGAMHDLRDW